MPNAIHHSSGWKKAPSTMTTTMTSTMTTTMTTTGVRPQLTFLFIVSQEYRAY